MRRAEPDATDHPGGDLGPHAFAARHVSCLYAVTLAALAASWGDGADYWPALARAATLGCFANGSRIAWSAPNPWVLANAAHHLAYMYLAFTAPHRVETAISLFAELAMVPLCNAMAAGPCWGAVCENIMLFAIIRFRVCAFGSFILNRADGDSPALYMIGLCLVGINWCWLVAYAAGSIRLAGR
jgi:hypothetical protein